VVNQALDSIMGMAVQMPALKKLGEELGLSMEDGVSGITSAALGVEAPRPAVVNAPAVVNGDASEAEPGPAA
jgi:flotillin